MVCDGEFENAGGIVFTNIKAVSMTLGQNASMEDLEWICTETTNAPNKLLLEA